MSSSSFRVSAAGSRLARRGALPMAAALVAAALSGCGSASPGAAAVVGDRQIDVGSLQQAHRDLQVLPVQGEVTQSQVLSLLVISDVVLEEASSRGVAVSASDARNQVRALLETDDDQPIGPEAARALQTLLAVQRIGGELPQDQAVEAQEAVVERLQAMDVEVNPRYGRFDPDRATIVATQHPWLAAAAPAGGAQPAPEDGAPSR